MMHWYQFPEWLAGWLCQQDWTWLVYIGHWVIFFTLCLAAIAITLKSGGAIILLLLLMLEPPIRRIKRSVSQTSRSGGRDE